MCFEFSLYISSQNFLFEMQRVSILSSSSLSVQNKKQIKFWIDCIQCFKSSCSSKFLKHSTYYEYKKDVSFSRNANSFFIWSLTLCSILLMHDSKVKRDEAMMHQSTCYKVKSSISFENVYIMFLKIQLFSSIS